MHASVDEPVCDEVCGDDEGDEDEKYDQNDVGCHDITSGLGVIVLEMHNGEKLSSCVFVRRWISSSLNMCIIC